MTDRTWGRLIPPVQSVPVSPVDERGLLVRLRLTALETGHVLLAVPALALLIVVLVSWPLAPIAVGLLTAGVAVPLAQALADLHRAVAGRVLGEQIAAGYAPTGRAGLLGRPWIWLRDSARWRDVAFLAFASTGGFAMSVAVVALLVSPALYLSLAIGTGDAWWLLLALPGPVVWWLVTPPLVRGRALAERGILQSSRTAELERRVAVVSASRAETVDHSAAELRRIERDLHDGAQARIVSLGMHLGLAEELLRENPAAAEALLREARNTTMSALDDLRAVVHGIHPPVLADRGLAGAVEALALQLAVPVTIAVDLPGRAPAPVESAMYFAVAECLANTAKHGGASRAWVSLHHHGGVLTVEVHDDGVGGADTNGSGLRGVARRLQAFDGTMSLDSPAGGPTIVTLGVPCELSSPKTSPS
jgi:signal transduction histidine kinase